MENSRLKKFPEYRHMIDDAKFSQVMPVENTLPMDELMTEIFAPNPRTGVPSSDLHIVMSRDARPEVANYIRDNMMRPLGNSVGSDDVDLALDTTKNLGEDLELYGNRLRDIVAKYNQPKVEKK